MSQVLDNWKAVFKEKRYVVLAIFSALAFYLINSFILNFQSLIDSYPLLGLARTIEVFFIISANLQNSILWHSLISLIISSILVGTLVSFIAYKVYVVRAPSSKKTNFLGSIGIFLAALAPGCAVCGIGLISALGLAGIIATFLPFEGLEISILAIAILAFANWKISRELFICKTSITKAFKYPKNPKNITQKAERRKIK